MESFKFNKRTLIGIFIIIIGIIFLLGTFEYLDSGYIFSTYWPIILIIFGLLSLIDNSTNKIFGIILVLIGVFYQLKSLGLLFKEIEIWYLIWPIVLIIVGIWFIMPKRKHEVSLDTLNNTVIFAGGDIVNVSQDFRGGEVTAIFGGLDIDLRKSAITTDEPVVIEAFTAFGGIDIKVPDDWEVVIKGIPIFGGWDNKRKNYKPQINNQNVLTVKCLVLFGGIDIK